MTRRERIVTDRSVQIRNFRLIRVPIRAQASSQVVFSKNSEEVLDTTRRSLPGVLAIALGILVSLALMGRVWWCQAGDLRPWSWDVWSRHNSQHLLDPYSLSHVQHGLGLYLLLTALLGRRLPSHWRVLTVAIVEAAWEIVENTNWMIERYRETTISLEYYGDSILNSLGDYTTCLLGVLLASRLRWWATVGLFAALELISVLWIRDSLLLNILMLIHPVDAVRQWQMAG
jgi:hypothetical protein